MAVKAEPANQSMICIDPHDRIGYAFSPMVLISDCVCLNIRDQANTVLHTLFLWKVLCRNVTHQHYSMIYCY